MSSWNRRSRNTIKHEYANNDASSVDVKSGKGRKGGKGITGEKRAKGGKGAKGEKGRKGG